LQPAIGKPGDETFIQRRFREAMKAIIIGAGRGRRLMPTTADTPKCFAEVKGRRLLDWALHALRCAGITDICFIGGYKMEKVRRDYPDLAFRDNAGWEQNNILLSLMQAEDMMEEGFVCCYSDILFTSDVVQRVVDHSADIALSVDTRWLERYRHRTQHPPDDAEKVTVSRGLVTRVHRGIPPQSAHGEYTGIARFSPAGAAQLREHFHRAEAEFAGKPFREAAVFEKAYLIQLYQEMIEAGVEIAHADTPGNYLEVDTQEDFELARRSWLGES
jgi:choline kinase